MLTGLCGMRLNTAGVVVGWVGAAFSVLTTIILAFCLGRLDDLVKLFMDHLNNPDISAEDVRRVIIIVCSAYITINVINLVASALLIVGTVKERHLLLVPWLFNAGASLFFSAIYAVFIVVSSIAGSAPLGAVVFPIISSAISLGIHFIIWYAIYSLFKQIQAGREQQQTLLRTTAGATSYPSYTKI